MVKLDYDRDYYADLELPPTADVVEVKKQFKRLALKWHPDRNPGKEDEAKERFLVVQAAHEILTDPVSKTKFDAHRHRSARYSFASGVRGNPWQSTSHEVNQKFGVPPKRPPMPTRTAAQPAATSRYWDWAPRARPKTDAKPNTKTENAKANISEAWDRSRPQPKPSQPAAANRPMPREPPTPLTASQARRQEAAFGTRKTGFAPASAMGDEPPVRNQHYNTSANTAVGESAPQASKPRPASTYVDPLSAQFSEIFGDARQRTPYAANTGEKTDLFEGLNVNRAKSMRDGSRRPEDSAGGNRPPPPPRQRSASVGSDSFKRSTGEKPSFDEASWFDPAFQSPSRANARYSPRGAETNPAPSTAAFPEASTSASSVDNSTNATVNSEAAAQAKNGTKVFSVPVDDEPALPNQKARFARNSADSINTRFVADRNAAGFRFSAGAAAAEDKFLRAKHQARGRQSPLRKEFTPQTETTDGGPQEHGTGKKQGEFDPQQWEEAFGPYTFGLHIPVPPQANRPSGSPAWPVRPIKKPRPVRMTAGTAGMVDDEETTSGEDRAKPGATPSGISGTRSPNAMDIDTPPPEPMAAQAAGARNINVEPTKPEWRAGDVNGVKPEPRLGAGLNNKPNLKPTAAGSEDSDEFARPIFSEFRNVEPFAQKMAGLSSLADLTSKLPFPSRPAAKIALAHEKARPPEMPSPPAAPRPPAGLVVPGTKLGAPAWMTYVREFEAYLGLWLDFNKKVTDHFAARQRLHERKGLAWLNAQGDDAAGGVDDYLRAQEEDKYVRQRWMAACETHELHFREFVECRRRVMRQ